MRPPGFVDYSNRPENFRNLAGSNSISFAQPKLGVAGERCKVSALRLVASDASARGMF
jgi:hypothetical protein